MNTAESPSADRRPPSIAGYRASCYIGAMNDWFMNQITVTPSPVEFGSITADKTVTVGVFNTFRHTSDIRTLNDVDLIALGAGISLTGDRQPPIQFKSFESSTIDFTATLEGDPTMNGLAGFEFDNVTIEVLFTGQRVILFGFLEIDDPVTEQLSWLTDIMKAEDGGEQRHALRDAPRQRLTFTYTYKETDPEASRMRNLLLQNLPFVWGIPLIWEALKTTAAEIVSSTNLTLGSNIQYADYQVGSSAIVFPSDGSSAFEVVIASIGATALTLDQPLEVAVPAGSLVAPLRTAYIVGQPTYQDPKYGLLRTRIIFETLQNYDLANVDGSFTTLSGNVVLDDPNMISGQLVNRQLSQTQNEFDPRVGLRYQTRRELFADVIASKSTVLHTMEDIRKWRELLHDLRGSWKPFYLPTFRTDVQLQSDYDLSTASLVVEPVGLTNFGGLEPRGAVLIRLEDGTGRQYVRAVSNVTDNTSNETIDLSSAPEVGSEVIPKELVRVSWVTLNRIEGDVATFRHSRVGEATLTFATRGIQD